ncbi:MAG: hypothetical protein GY898_31425 [Proteobacteria bacterium]|nr:hypothetical protein [Pseudomonadota bacterium]
MNRSGWLALAGALGLIGCGPAVGNLGSLVPPDDDDDAVDDDDDDDDLTPPDGAGDVVINEVASEGGDLIELYNRSDSTVDLSGWELLDDDWAHNPYAIPVGTELSPGGFFAVDANTVEFGIGDEDTVRLIAPDGYVVEEVTWEAGAAAVSWCRYTDGTDNWDQCTIATPGAANTMEGIPDNAGDVVINEIRSTDGDRIELYNRSSFVFDLGGWALLDDNDTHEPFVFGEGVTLAPGEFLDINGAATGLGLGPEDSVRFYAPSGLLIEEAAWKLGAAEVSWCRFPDGADDSWGNCTLHTPGAPNTQEYPGVLIEPLWIAGLDDAHDPAVEVDEPNELAFDLSGQLWAGDQDNLRVQVFDLNGNFVTSFGGSGSGPGEFTPRSNGNNQGPESMRPGSDGLMYVVDRIGRRVNVYDTDAMVALPSIAGDGPLVDPTGLAVDSADNLYVADQNTNQVHVFDSTGVHTRTFDFEDAFGDQILWKVETLAIDEASDRLFATSENEAKIEVFQMSTGTYLGGGVTGPRDSGGPALQPGRITTTIEGIQTETVAGLLFISDESAGRMMVHDLTTPDLYDPAADYAFRGGFSSTVHFAGADGVYPSAVHDRVAVADQVGSRVQVFLLSEVYEALGIE